MSQRYTPSPSRPLVDKTVEYGDGLRSVTAGVEDVPATLRERVAADAENLRDDLELGDVATHDASEFATSAQGTAAGTAVQPGDLPDFGDIVTHDAADFDAAGLAAGAESAAKSYADGLVIGLLDDRGSFNASVNTWPTTGGSGSAGTIMKGDLWSISVIAVSGPLLGLPIGCLIRALVDTPGQTTGNWSVVEVGFGYVAENADNKSDAIETDKASTTKYPQLKAIYDWAVGKFATAAQGTDERVPTAVGLTS